MHSTPFRRAVAVVLCCQPVFWMSNTALAQALQPSNRPSGMSPWLGGDTSGLGGGPERDMSQPEASAPSMPPALPSPELESMKPAPVVPRAPSAGSPIDEPVDPDRYVCGPGDVLELNYWGLQNFKMRVTIDLEGRAFVPKIGNFELQGKTLSEARRLLREAAARYYPRLSFDASLAEPRTFLVQVVNGVVQPGSQPARAIDRVGTIIERAGGFGPKASQRRIEIRRRDGTVLHADLLRYRTTGDTGDNPFLLDGDVVRVPFEELAAAIEGAVNRPGRYELVGTRDLAELVEMAGGLSSVATRKLPIRLVRLLPDDRQDQQLLPFGADGALPTIALQHEDAVRIPDFGEVQRSITVLGAISGAATPEDPKATRRLPFVVGDSVRSVLDRAGGLGPLADLQGAYVIRGDKTVALDLQSLIMLRDPKADRPIELGDTLVVPFKRRSIRVTGAVFVPGYYAYNPDYRADEYIALAGGPNRFGKSVSSARVIGPDGETMDYDRDLEIKPGSQLIIPERSFSPPEIVQIILSAASVLVSGVAVMLAARR